MEMVSGVGLRKASSFLFFNPGCRCIWRWWASDSSTHQVILTERLKIAPILLHRQWECGPANRCEVIIGIVVPDVVAVDGVFIALVPVPVVKLRTKVGKEVMVIEGRVYMTLQQPYLKAKHLPLLSKVRLQLTLRSSRTMRMVIQ